MSLRFLLQLLRPSRRTTEAEVNAAMARYGISPDDIEWAVGADGSFAFGQKSSTVQTFTTEQSMRLHEWARHERIKVRIIAWETSGT